MSYKSLDLHAIVSLQADNIDERTTAEGNTYFVRHLMLLDKDGQEFRITLFADARTNLVIEA